MPILKSSKKALRVSRRKQTRNILQTRQMNEAIRRADAKSVSTAVSLIDKAVKKNLIHANKAARLKSRLAKKIGSTPKVEKKPASVVAKKVKTATKKASPKKSTPPQK